ncbi:MAG: oligoendopeptidase F, partial [Pseudomonadota bacterium]
MNITYDARDFQSSDFGDLPNWKLDDLYPGEDSPELTKDMDWLRGEAASFASDYEGKLADLDAAGMLNCITRKEAMSSVSGRIMSFAYLRYAQNTTDPARSKFLGDMQNEITEITTPLVFFSLEFNRIEDATYEAWMADNADLARYRPALDRMRAMKPYQLSDELEKFLHDQSVVGAAAWNRLFDETNAGLKFEIDGEEMGIEAVLNLQSDTDRAKREASSHELARVFQDNIGLFARITNTLAKEKAIEDKWRGLPTPQSGRHIAN